MKFYDFHQGLKESMYDWSIVDEYKYCGIKLALVQSRDGCKRLALMEGEGVLLCELGQLERPYFKIPEWSMNLMCGTVVNRDSAIQVGNMIILAMMYNANPEKARILMDMTREQRLADYQYRCEMCEHFQAKDVMYKYHNRLKLSHELWYKKQDQVMQFEMNMLGW